jgi:hypothetical protein
MSAPTPAIGAPEKKGNGREPGIQFNQLLTLKGEPVLGPKGAPLTLGEACELALDSALRTDDGEGLKPKLRRGRLIEQISEAAAAMRQLAIEAEDIKLIKERISSTFAAASLVRHICLLLDPASKE